MRIFEDEFERQHTDRGHGASVEDFGGHALGDELLRIVSKRLRGCVREGATVARLGGDEFAVLFENIKSVENALRITDRIQCDMILPFFLETRSVFKKASNRRP